MGAAITDEDFTAIIMGSIPASYRSLLQSVAAAARVANKDIAPLDLIQWVTEEYKSRIKRERRDKNDTELFSKGKKSGKGCNHRHSQKKSDVECSNCDKKGHTVGDCWLPGGGKEGQRPHQRRKGNSANAARENKKVSEDDNFAFLCTSNFYDAPAAFASTQP